jgi:MarR-like DNA-binding transcriptional regulator SgrR of sgrS sRNA
VRDDEAKRWRFTLRTDVVFHDGSRCDAQAVRASLQRLADPRQSNHARLLSGLVGWNDFAAGRAPELEGLDVVDSDDIELRFESPVTDLAARLALPAASIARRRGGEWLGTGPFQVLAASSGEVRLAAFRDHYAGRPYLDHVEFVSRALTEKTLAGNVAEFARVLVAEPLPGGAVRWRAPAERLGFALVQPQSAVLASEPVRSKLASGFDRSVFVRAALGGDGEPTEGLSPQGTKTVSGRGSEQPPGDIGTRAQQRARIVVPQSEPVLKALGERLQVHLFAQGLAADLDLLGDEALSQALSTRNYDIVVLGWTPPQPSVGALDQETRAQNLSSSVLVPVLGEALPEAWSPGRLTTAKDPEAVLLRGSYLMPLVFFHDLWQTNADLLDLDLGAAAATLGSASAHLESHTP